MEKWGILPHFEAGQYKRMKSLEKMSHVQGYRCKDVSRVTVSAQLSAGISYIVRT